MDEAVHFGHHDVVTILRDYHTQYSPQEPTADKQNAEKNLDGMLWRDTAPDRKPDGWCSRKSTRASRSEGREVLNQRGQTGNSTKHHINSL